MKKWANELNRAFSDKIGRIQGGMAVDMNRAFSKEEVQRAEKHMKNCSPSLVIREMQIKTMLRFHVRVAIIKNTTTKAGEDMGGKEPSYTADGNVN
jgi:hypothetical protein